MRVDEPMVEIEVPVDKDRPVADENVRSAGMREDVGPSVEVPSPYRARPERNPDGEGKSECEADALHYVSLPAKQHT
jgi:hypothetical protein